MVPNRTMFVNAYVRDREREPRNGRGAVVRRDGAQTKMSTSMSGLSPGAPERAEGLTGGSGWLGAAARACADSVPELRKS